MRFASARLSGLPYLCQRFNNPRVSKHHTWLQSISNPPPSTLPFTITFFFALCP
ncbi:hypothetical protein OG21DRAFT_1518251 [Imleria badia]|nr:hypothetical protein OG21DRAFT_1518251 [Imleria badia]